MFILAKIKNGVNISLDKLTNGIAFVIDIIKKVISLIRKLLNYLEKALAFLSNLLKSIKSLKEKTS